MLYKLPATAFWWLHVALGALSTLVLLAFRRRLSAFTGRGASMDVADITIAGEPHA